MEESFVCIKYEKKKLYLAVYFVDSGIISLSELWTPIFDSSIPNFLKFQYNPSTFLIQSTSSEQIKSSFQSFNLLHIPKSDYLFDTCKNLLITSIYSNNQTLA